MNFSVCTLFENGHHVGVATLINSLIYNGFKGNLYLGYRGKLPPWVNDFPSFCDSTGNQYLSVKVASDVQAIFIPIESSVHLANFKPQFLLFLFNDLAVDDHGVLYVDPDILVNYSWTFFSDWLQCGLCLCEDVDSPLSEFHPRRLGWRKFFHERGFSLSMKTSLYCNSGAVGVLKSHRSFLQTWATMTAMMSDQIGGMGASKVEGGDSFTSKGFANCFSCADQDSLNAALEASDETLSILGQDAMAIVPGHHFLPHAYGLVKPWKRNYLMDSLHAIPPRIADKTFWKYVDGPIQVFSDFRIRNTRLAIKVSSAIGRFYKRV